MKIVGLISGSSLDGLDIAICNFALSDGTITYVLEKADTISFDEKLIESLKNATKLEAKELFALEVSFSQFCAEAIRSICGNDLQNIDYIASHGHTIFHHPEERFTIQIGNGGIIAEGVRKPCITDFRMNDVALGGQGAPVAPIVEQYLFPGYDFFVNLGGIANISCHSADSIQSLDTCPCNQVLNHLSQQLGQEYDKGGQLARRGLIQEGAINGLGTLDYFQLPFPKSMDNSWVTQVFLPEFSKYDLSTEDALATMVEFIAIQLQKDAALLSSGEPGQMKAFMTGGGAFNTYLLERIGHYFKQLDIDLAVPDHSTINFKEAILMALMGYLRVMKLSNTIPSVTGASRPTVGGAVYWSR